MGTLTIRIDDQLEAELEQLAKARHRSKSDLAREMLRRNLALESFEEARRRLVPLAEKAGYLTDEDVFKDVSRGHTRHCRCTGGPGRPLHHRG
jgi:predicted transcriptional regulator